MSLYRSKYSQALQMKIYNNFWPAKERSLCWPLLCSSALVFLKVLRAELLFRDQFGQYNWFCDSCGLASASCLSRFHMLGVLLIFPDSFVGHQLL